jgi:CDP-diacylglycerol---serine O-phosphatidyltransferase
MTRQIPNLFTLLNLFFGCIAIVFILQTNSFSYYYNDNGNAAFAGVDSMPQEWWYASLFIALAAVVDFFDGFIARLLGASSEMGKQLDSLADVVSFGVAPSMILYQMLRMSYMQSSTAMDTSMWLLCPAFIVACAGAYRLAKFNISTDQTKYFTGVPIPAIGLIVAAYPLILLYNKFGIATILLNKWVIYSIIIILSYLMVCNYKMLSLKISKSEIGKQIPLFIIAGIGILSVIFLGWLAVPIIFVAYVVLSLLNQNKMKA